jgi:hypothetical protein
MSVRIIALFNLKPGVSREEYEAWAKRVDIPTVTGLGSINAFEVYRSTGLLGSDASPPYAYIEVIDVADMDAFGADVSSETMQRVAAAFQEMAADLFFITTEKL